MPPELLSFLHLADVRRRIAFTPRFDYCHGASLSISPAMALPMLM